MTSKPARHPHLRSLSTPKTPQPMNLPVAKSDVADENVGSRLQTTRSVKPTDTPDSKVPDGIRFPSRATVNEVCHNFQRNQCFWGTKCHRIHVLSPDDQPLDSKNPLDSRSPLYTVSATNEYIVKLPSPQFPEERGQMQTPSNGISAQSSCFIDLPDDSIAPVVRLRRSMHPAEKPSQSGGTHDYKYDDLSWDENTSFFGWKSGANSWGDSSMSSDDTESSSAKSATETASSQSSVRSSHMSTTMTSPPPPTREVCRNWSRYNSCYYGSSCRFAHRAHNPPNLPPRLREPPPLSTVPVHPTSIGKVYSQTSTSSDHPQSRKTYLLPPSRELCRMWLQDRCRHGPRCRYVHGDVDYDPPNPPPRPCDPPPPAPPPPELSFTVTVHDHTKVKIGPGFEIQELTTSVETPWIVLSNIPARMKANAVIAHLAPFGSVVDLRLPGAPSKDVMTVKARFSSHAAALQASAALDGSTVFKTRISARLPVNSRSGGMVSIQDSTVRVLWEAPQKVAYGGYPSPERADEALVAAKVLLGDYHVSASIHVGLPSIGTITVRFANLPPDADEKYMERFGRPEDVMWERPNYLALTPAVDGIKRILSSVGNMLELDVLPPPYSHGLVRGWAVFSSSSAARAAAATLHGRKPVFTGKTRVVAHHVQTLSFSISLETYQKDVSLIDGLREAAFHHGYGMAVAVRLLPANVLVRLSADGIKPLGWLKAEFEKISRGEILRQDGVAVWDQFFARSDSAAFLHNLTGKDRDVRIEVDAVRRLLKLFGPPHKRASLRTTLLQKMAELKTQRVRVIRVPGRVVGAFIATQLEPLSLKFGAENVQVDFWERAVTLRGDDALYDAGVEAVHQAQQSPLAQRKYPRNVVECPVCFNEVVSPIRIRCGHTWCRACFCQYLLAAIETRRFPLTCLGDEAKCSERISLKTARDVLQPNEFNSVVESSVSSYVQAHAKEFHYCPSPDCLQIYRTGPKGTVVQCPACLLRICPHCHAEAHDGFACAEQDGGDRLFKEWVASHDVKNCPGCAIAIERDEGCHHVTCVQCQTHICWVCLQTFPKGEGIYAHMRTEHGGIGVGEE